MITVDPRRPTTSDGARPQRWVLLVGDPATGAATRPVGVLGVAGQAWHVSWLPLEPAATLWCQRLAAASDVAITQRVAWWAEHANGLTVDLAAIDSEPDAGDLHDAVERAVDDLLAAPLAT